MVLDRVNAAMSNSASNSAARVADPDVTTTVRSHDGHRLATDVHLPSATARRAGCTALLLRTPYGKRGTIDRVAELAPYFTAAGCAVVVQDVRGKFASEGAIMPFIHEVADGHATAQWIAEQPWSDGAVVPFGDSYAGFTSWAAAASGHPAVRAAIVRVTTSHLPDEWMYRQGAFRLQQNAQWATFAWSGQELLDVEPDWSVRPLAEIAGAGTPQLMAWLGASPASPSWHAAILGHQPPLSRHVDVPVLHWGGWWDLMARGQLREWRSLVGEGSAPQRLVMGATDHSFNSFSCVYGADPATSFEHHYGAIADFLTTAVGGNVGATGSRVRWELTHEAWHEDLTWPPLAAEPGRLYLSDAPSAAFGPEGGALTSIPDSMAATINLPHDPVDLVPSLETFVWGTLANAYPDERDVHIRPDVMTFSGAAAVGPVDIVGPVTLRLWQQAPEEGAQITAVLSDVHPDGRALRIAEGAIEIDAATRAGRVEIDLGPLAYRLRDGHRLRLALAASAFPRYLWHASDRLAAWSSMGGSTPHEITVRLGGESFLDTHYLRRRP